MWDIALSLRDMVAPKTLANFLDRKTQLYEQGADVRRIGQYVRNWWRWVRAGVDISLGFLLLLCLHSQTYYPIPDRTNI